MIDSFTEDDLSCVAAGRPEKTWHEAVCWAIVAWGAEKRSSSSLQM